MGAACSDDKYDSVESDMDSKRPDLPKHHTVRGLETVEDVAGYRVGSGVGALTHSVLAEMSGPQDPVRYGTIFKKHKVYFYFYATISWICNGDGVLHEKEKKYIQSEAKALGLEDDQINQFFTNSKDYSKEFISATENAWKEFDPTLDKQDMNKKLVTAREYLVLYTLIAAAQDGLHKDEYNVAKHMAKNLGLGQDCAEQCVALLKAEQDMARKITSKFS